MGRTPPAADVGVLQQVERDVAVVGGRLRVVEDAPQLCEVRRPQEVRDVVHRRVRQEPQRLRRHLEEGPPGRLDGAHPVPRQEPVARCISAARQEIGIQEGRGGAGHAPEGTLGGPDDGRATAGRAWAAGGEAREAG
jgi:hypothetical protein